MIKNKYFIIVIAILATSFASNAEIFQVKENTRLVVKISRSGINRIANPPYQITQVTGNDNKYRLKSDEDGNNIYLLPMVKMGEIIELSIKNNIGQIFDLDLKVANIKGRSIILTESEKINPQKEQREDIAKMLKSMKEGVADKFYLQQTKQDLDPINRFSVMQVKLYKWKNLIGGVFLITNKTKKCEQLDYENFIKRFSNVKAYFADSEHIAPGKTALIFIIQKSGGE